MHRDKIVLSSLSEKHYNVCMGTLTGGCSQINKMNRVERGGNYGKSVFRYTDRKEP